MKRTRSKLQTAPNQLLSSQKTGCVGCANPGRWLHDKFGAERGKEDGVEEKGAYGKSGTYKNEEKVVQTF